MAELHEIRQRLDSIEEQVRDARDGVYNEIAKVKQMIKEYENKEQQFVQEDYIKAKAKLICETAGVEFTGFSTIDTPDAPYNHSGEWKVKICSSGAGRYDANKSGRTLQFDRKGALTRFELGWGGG